MQSFTKISIFFLLLSCITSNYVKDDTITYTCETVSTSKVKRLDEVSLCLHLQPIQLKVGFRVKVDVPTVIRIDDMFNNLKDKTTQINVMAQMKYNKFYSMEAPYFVSFFKACEMKYMLIK